MISRFTLQTVFNGDDTVTHVNGMSGPVNFQRRDGVSINVCTTWKRDTELGTGSFGEVWREKSTGGQLRAVKTITKFTLKSNKMDYERELEVLVKVKDVQSPRNPFNFASTNRHTTSAS